VISLSCCAIIDLNSLLDNSVARCQDSTIDLSKRNAILVWCGMKYDDISEFSAETSEGTIRVRAIQLENGLLLLVSNSEKYRLGLSAVAIPPGSGRTDSTSTGLFTTGTDAHLVRTVAEHVSSWTNQTCMIVMGVKNLTRQITVEITTLLRNHLLT